MGDKRPLAIILISIVTLLVAIYLFLFSFYLGSNSFIELGQSIPFFSSVIIFLGVFVTPLLSQPGVLVNLSYSLVQSYVLAIWFYIILGILFILSFIGLLLRNKFSKYFIVLSGFIFIIGDLISLFYAGFFYPYIIISIISLFIWASIVFYLLFNKKAKEYFK